MTKMTGNDINKQLEPKKDKPLMVKIHVVLVTGKEFEFETLGELGLTFGIDWETSKTWNIVSCHIGNSQKSGYFCARASEIAAIRTEVIMD